MQIISCEIEDIKLIKNIYSFDNRGSFTKIFQEKEFKYYGLNTNFKETYYSVSNKNVIRGMHFQLPPYEHDKLIYVITGSVMDVVVDLRKSSLTYKKSMSIMLDSKARDSLYIPKGFAHGFKALEDNTLMLYQVTSEYQKEFDSGIAFDSIGYDWNITEPIISQRDCNFVSLEEFDSPF